MECCGAVPLSSLSGTRCTFVYLPFTDIYEAHLLYMDIYGAHMYMCLQYPNLTGFMRDSQRICHICTHTYTHTYSGRLGQHTCSHAPLWSAFDKYT